MNVLGRYEVHEQLGTGSMGTVYRARDTVLDRDVALKTIRTSGDVEPEIRERFYREARACARLQHPNITGVFDLGEADQIAFIAMELLRGSDLRKVIEERRPLSLHAKLEAMIQICDGLHHAHRHGVIHRDIKPSNLFLQDDGRAKVMDFGIARLPSSRLTVAGNILGTPNYMAPEQILGKVTDARADIFSSALVFFEFLTYIHPFHAAVIPHRIVEGEPDSLFDHEPNAPVLLEKVLARALSKDPEARYGSAEEMCNDLRAVLDGVRLNASPTMSKVELPSERAIPREARPPEGDLTLLKPAPAGEDPAEWRLSEVLRLLPEFEDAMDRRNETAARTALNELRAIATADRRFTEAAESCAASFAKVFGDGGTRGQAVAPPVKGEAVSSSQPAGAAAVPAPAAQAIPREARPRVSRDQKRTLITAAIVIGAIVVLGWLISLFSRPVSLEPAVGTAKVTAATAFVRENAEPDSTVIAQGSRDESLRLLDLPRDKTTQWIRVQPVINGKTYVPGYVRLAELEDWSEWAIGNSASLAQMARIYSPQNDASDELIKSQVSKLGRLADRIAGDPAEAEVRQEIARLEKILNERLGGIPEQTEDPGAAGGTGPLPTTAGTATPPPAEATDQTAPQEESPARKLARAKRYFDRLDLTRAKALVREVLVQDPANTAARDLLNRIEGVESLERLDAPTPNR